MTIAEQKKIFSSNQLPENITLGDVGNIIDGAKLSLDMVKEIIEKFLAEKITREDLEEMCLPFLQDKIEILRGWGYRMGVHNPPFP